MKRTAAIVLLLSIGWFTSPPTGYGAAANPPEEIWKSLEKLPPDEREKKLMEGAKAEGEMLWYTNSGMENAGRYIQAFKKKVGRDTTTQMMMAGEAPLSVTTYAYNSESLRAQNAPIDWLAQDLIPTLMYPLTLARHAPHPHSAALFYDFLLSEQGQQLIAKEGRVVAHPKVDPIYPRMKELQGLLGTSRVQLNTVEQNHKLYKDGLQILDEIVLKRKSSSL